MLIGKKDGSWFSQFARTAATAAGKPSTFMAAVAALLIWGASGPIFGFSDTWQLIINTGTTIVTFLMVFVIQNSQNRDSEAIQVKLDELIRAIDGAQNRLLDLEELEQEDIGRLRKEYRRLASDARNGNGSGSDCPPSPASDQQEASAAEPGIELVEPGDDPAGALEIKIGVAEMTARDPEPQPTELPRGG
jgi:low affinity Fe/Cu permease